MSSRSLSSSSSSSSPSSSPTSFSSSSSVTPTATVSDSSLATLFHSVPAAAICVFLPTTDVLSVASVNRATRRLLLSSPAVWRTRVFGLYPALLFSPLCDVVQVVEAKGFISRSPERPKYWPLTLASLCRYPCLRRLHTQYEVLTTSSARRQTLSSSVTSQPLTPSPPSLSSMRHLTRLSLGGGGQLSVEDMRLLATLPVLASFEACGMSAERGNASTVRQWRALSNGQQQRGTKRKAEQQLEEEEEEEEEKDTDEQELDADQDEREDEDDEEVDSDGETIRQEDPNDHTLPRKYSALLLFLHALAAKPSLVHLALVRCRLTPFVLDHMPVWPYLLSLDLQRNDNLRRYRFERAATCFSSLTSLASPSSTDAAIAHLIQLPALEELRFHEYVTVSDGGGGGGLTSERGFQSLSKALKLRSIVYKPLNNAPQLLPSAAALIALFTLANLTRLTLSAAWPIDGLLADHRFEHLRCLELVVYYDSDIQCTCPQTDAVLMPLVKPLSVLVAGRERRQAARAAKRPVYWSVQLQEDQEADGGRARCEQNNHKPADAVPVIPADNAANFPSLECLALPHEHYASTEVGRWMKAQLRRSYEYEVAAEWEAEQTTLGCVELLKTIMA